MDNEKENNLIFNNSIKDNNYYRNIRPLQSAASSLTAEEMSISLNIFFSSMKYIKSWSKTDNIFIVYIPSPVSCYIWNEPIEYEYKSEGFVNVKTISNKENTLKSRFIRKKIENFSKKNNIQFLDMTEHISNMNKILHGPLDWRHFNYDGYKMISDYLAENL